MNKLELIYVNVSVNQGSAQLANKSVLHYWCCCVVGPLSGELLLLTMDLISLNYVNNKSGQNEDFRGNFKTKQTVTQISDFILN